METLTYKPSIKSINKIKLSCLLAIIIIWLILIIKAELTLLTFIIGILSSILIPFGIIMMFNFPKNTQVDLAKTSITFHVLAAEDSPFIFHFNEIDKIVVGSVKSSFRQNRNSFRKFFGIELQLSEKLDEYTINYLYSFPIKHMENYLDLINKLEAYSNLNNIPFEKRIV
ncbi:MAG: hypothetical protein ACRDA4_04920 [Filifactoraceae bacterium]